jgi:hypothetical protein
MTQTLLIAPRFCGPPGSGNGGYVCGRIAAYLCGPAQVTLRRPAPLATPLSVERDGHGSVRVLDGDTLVAEGIGLADDLTLGLPDPVSIAEARAAGTRCRLRVHPDQHPFPGCFVCGPDRPPADGLHILVGPVAGRELSADVWYPDEALAGPDGHVRPEFVWAGWPPVRSPRSRPANHMSWSAGAWPKTAARSWPAPRCSPAPGKQSASRTRPGSVSTCRRYHARGWPPDEPWPPKTEKRV